MTRSFRWALVVAALAAVATIPMAAQPPQGRGFGGGGRMGPGGPGPGPMRFGARRAAWGPWAAGGRSRCG